MSPELTQSQYNYERQQQVAENLTLVFRCSGGSKEVTFQRWCTHSSCVDFFANPFPYWNRLHCLLDIGKFIIIIIADIRVGFKWLSACLEEKGCRIFLPQPRGSKRLPIVPSHCFRFIPCKSGSTLGLVCVENSSDESNTEQEKEHKMPLYSPRWILIAPPSVLLSLNSITTFKRECSLSRHTFAFFTP